MIITNRLHIPKTTIFHTKFSDVVQMLIQGFCIPKSYIVYINSFVFISKLLYKPELLDSYNMCILRLRCVHMKLHFDKVSFLQEMKNPLGTGRKKLFGTL